MENSMDLYWIGFGSGIFLMIIINVTVLFCGSLSKELRGRNNPKCDQSTELRPLSKGLSQTCFTYNRMDFQFINGHGYVTLLKGRRDVARCGEAHLPAILDSSGLHDTVIGTIWLHSGRTVLDVTYLLHGELILTHEKEYEEEEENEFLKHLHPWCDKMRFESL